MGLALVFVFVLRDAWWPWWWRWIQGVVISVSDRDGDIVVGVSASLKRWWRWWYLGIVIGVGVGVCA